MASVHPRTSPRTGVTAWRVMFRLAGGVQKQESFDDERAARQFARQVDTHGAEAALRVLIARRDADVGMPTLAEFTARYLRADSGLLSGVQPGTRRSYVVAAERSFLSMLGELPVDAISKTDVGRWLDWQAAQPSLRRTGRNTSPKTIKNYHSLLSQILAAAVEQKLRTDNPAYRTRITKGIREEKVFLSPDEFSTLLHFLPEQYERLVFILANTGLRWGEATALQWADLSLRADPPSIRVQRAWKKGPSGPVLGPPKSSKSQRTVSLSPDAAASFGVPGDPTSFIFRTAQGGHIWPARFMQSAWNPAVHKAMDRELCAAEGLVPLTRRPTPHDLRHSHASWLIARGAPLPYIQQRLGHESIQTTVDVYGHLVPDAQRQMADLVGATLQGVRPMRSLST